MQAIYNRSHCSLLESCPEPATPTAASYVVTRFAEMCYAIHIFF